MPKYKNKKKVDDETVVYEYSDGHLKKRDKEKAKKVEKLNKSVGDLRRKVKTDLKSSDDTTRLQALAVGLLDATFERVGNEESAEERGHFGVTTWKVKHVTFQNGKAFIKYTGKSGVRQEREVDDKPIVSAMKAQAKDKGKEDFLFDCGDEGDEDRVCIRAKDVNEYLKEFDVTAKDIRGYHANRLMQEELKTRRKDGPKLPEDSKEREELLETEFKDALDTVAGIVGHESATLKGNYLVPGLEATYLSEAKVLEKLDKKASVAISERVAYRYFLRK